jgi:folylpolyglutamate synthase/dihydropteroate synthase
MLNNKKANLFLSKIKKRVSKVLAIEIPDEKNSFKTKQINEICDYYSIKCEQVNNINDALKYFRSNQEKIYLITGSLYLIGKIRRRLL